MLILALMTRAITLVFSTKNASGVSPYAGLGILAAMNRFDSNSDRDTNALM